MANATIRVKYFTASCVKCNRAIRRSCHVSKRNDGFVYCPDCKRAGRKDGFDRYGNDRRLVNDTEEAPTVV